MIEVSYCNVKRKECSSCYEQGDILTIEHGSKNHTASFFLCNDCAEELRDKLEEYGSFQKNDSLKVDKIKHEIENSDMGTAVENIIRIVND